MPSIREVLTHLRKVYSSRGGKVIVLILGLSGGILGGIFIGLNNHSIPPLSGVWSTIVATLGFIFSFSLIAAILILYTKSEEEE